jgi:hypothetical protein
MLGAEKADRMRKVVDTNFLQSEELRAYLTEPSNFAVMTDYVVMEVLQRGSPDSIFKSIKILTEYPTQVIVLKSISAVCILKTRPRGRGLQKRLIDREQTSGFYEWCRKLDAARRDDKTLQAQLLNMREDAFAHLDLMLADMGTYAANLQAVAKNYTDAELKILRNDKPYTPEMHDKLVDNIFDLAILLFAAHPRRPRLPPSKKAANSFIFRFAICAHVLSLKWLRVGAAPDAAPKKFRNDAIDAAIVAFATYFDGLLTDDVKAMQLYRNASFLLKQFFIRQKK